MTYMNSLCIKNKFYANKIKIHRKIHIILTQSSMKRKIIICDKRMQNECNSDTLAAHKTNCAIGLIYFLITLHENFRPLFL